MKDENSSQKEMELLESIYDGTKEILRQDKKLELKVEELKKYYTEMYDKYKDHHGVLSTILTLTKSFKENEDFKEKRKEISERLDFLLRELDKKQKSDES